MKPQIETVKFADALNANCTYFTTSDAAPTVSDDGATIKMIDGSGAHRSWGSPRITSRVLWEIEDVVCIDVTGWHKHSVGPEGGEYYFCYSHKDSAWQRKRANAKVVQYALEEVDRLQAAGLRFDISSRAWRNANNELVELATEIEVA